MISTHSHLRVVVLAGGTGSRFWPASTVRRPKQLLPLLSDRPLVRETVERAAPLVPSGHLQVVAGRHLRQALTAALPKLPPSAFLWEPVPRSTAPALAWASWRTWKSDPDAIVASLHSDHLIRPTESFRSLIRRAARVAERTRMLMTVGARPDRPETGYGYLQAGEPLEEEEPNSADKFLPRRIVRFHEKPGATRAKDYLRRGFLWNTGIFVWRASTFLTELRTHAPEVGQLLPRLEEGDVEGFFRDAPAVSVDEAVLERTCRAAVLPATFFWDDVGSWQALARILPSGADGNRTTGEVLFRESADNIAYSDGSPVVLFGVRDLVVVCAGGVTMVTTRERAAGLKDLVNSLPAELR